MDADVTGRLGEVVPAAEHLLRLTVVLLTGVIVQLLVRPLIRARRARVKLAGVTVLPVVVLVLTHLATMVSPPLGLGASVRGLPWFAAWSLAWVVVLAVRVVNAGVDVFYERHEARAPIPPLLRRTVVALVYLGSAILILKYGLGVDITPLIATSAVLTMVLGLALQGVLGNLLAGFSLGAVRTVDVGDVVGMGELEGRVVRTNWRETILQTRDFDTVHVPNSKLAGETIVNYSKPSMLHRHGVNVSASYADRPDEVIVELERAAEEASMVKDHPPPVAFVRGYNDYGIDYLLYFFSEAYWTVTRVEGEVMRFIWYKFKRKGIEIPFPMPGALAQEFMATVRGELEPRGPSPAAQHAEILRRSSFLTREEAGERTAMLDDTSLGEFAADCRLQRYTTGEILCRQGESGESCYVVVSGAIDGTIDYTKEGTSQSSTFRTEPDGLFGEMSLVTGMPRAATGRIAAETELLEIPSEAFARLLGRHEHISMEIASLVAARNRENRTFLENLTAIDRDAVDASCDSRRILTRLKGLAAWGRRLVGQTR